MRIRTIKPEFFLHDGLFDAEVETGLPLRVAFCGLWCAADREGRFRWEPRRLGMQILPYDQVDFSRVLHALATRGFLVMYRVNDACFGWIPGFSRHQIVNNRERESEIPEFTPESAMEAESDACLTRDPRVAHASKAEGKGKEGKGIGNREGSVVASATRERLTPPTLEQWKEFAQTLTPAFPDIEAANAFYHYQSNGWRVGSNPVKDWKACCRKCHGKWCSESANPATGRSNARRHGGPCAGDPCPVDMIRDFDFDNPGTVPE